MKFFSVLVIVSLMCASALSDNSADDDLYFTSHFEYLLIQQHNTQKKAIVNAWKNCNTIYNVTVNDGLDMFQNLPPGERRDASSDAKCLIECTLVTLGARNQDGFRKAEYMVHIKQLLMNYTSFNVNTKPRATRRQIFETIDERTETLTDYRIQRESVFGRIMFGPPPKLKTNYNFDVIQAYERAADMCKDVKDPQDDDCETAFLIMRCIMDRNRERNFRSPPYPVPINALH